MSGSVFKRSPIIILEGSCLFLSGHKGFALLAAGEAERAKMAAKPPIFASKKNATFRN